METLIDARGLAKRYPGFALEGISFRLEPGFVMGLIGENGAGKTTTIKCLMGLIRRDGGELSVLGLDPARDGARAREGVGYVSDENCLWEDMRVGAAVRVVSRFYRNWDWSAFKDRLAGFGLPPDRKIGQLSKGMRLKLNLAIALSHGADLLLLDEPTSGLDPMARDEFLGILRDYLAEGSRGVIFSTHITSDLEKIADFVTFIRSGKLVFSMDRESMAESFSLLRGGGSLPAGAREYLIGVKESAVGWEGLARDREAALAALGPGCAVERPSIEQIMLYHGKE
jgi:ABC-2 type transport system ATP-binding protein